MFSFFVPGNPRPQGSMRALVQKRRDGGIVCDARGNPIVKVFHKSDDKLRRWRELVGIVARSSMRGRPALHGPLVLEAVFLRERPLSHRGKRGLTKAGRESLAPDTAPDLDKLVRAAGDALTGVCYADDARIVGFRTQKIWAPSGCRPGAAFRLRPAGDSDVAAALRFCERIIGVEFEVQEAMAI